MAYVAVVVQSRLVGMDPSIEEAAMDLGARPAKVFFVITLPMVIYSKVRLGLSPEINALVTLLVVAVSLGMIAAGIIMTRQERQHLRDARMAVASTD